MTAQLLSEVCPNVEVEPPLQPLAKATFPHRKANVEDNASFDGNAHILTSRCSIHRRQPLAHKPSQQATDAMRMRRAYEKRVVEVEHGSLKPIVLSSTAEWGSSGMIMFKRLTLLITTKHSAAYSVKMRMIRCKIAFSVIDSTVMCLSGARSSQCHKPIWALDLIDPC